MLEAIITFLITLCVIAIVFYLIVWVLEMIGFTLPGKVIQLLWVIVALLAVLYLYKIVMGAGGIKALHLTENAPIVYVLPS